MKLIKSFSLAVGLALIVQACYPGGPSVVEDYDVVFATKVNNSRYDFSQDSNKVKVTYVLPDTIVDITDPNEVKNPPDITPALQNAIISQLETSFAAFGYDQLDDSEVNDADYIVFCQRLITNNFVTYFWGGWGCYYPGYCYGGWYPPSSTTYNYQTGTLYVTMIDVAASDTSNEQIAFVWDAGINGLLGTTSASTQNRAVNGIKRMFELSPYLNKN